MQAEAIADLIGSGTAQAARAALRSLSGAFSTAVNALAEQLMRLRMHVEAAIDFPGGGNRFPVRRAAAAAARRLRSAFDALMDETRQGRVLRDGYQVVIVGKPNAGKSSLMNLLSGEEAAIVTEVAGTTRDILREQIDIDGLAVELVDTAGLRDDPDRIEAEGIRRARKAVESADAVLWIQDASDSDHGGIDEELPEETPVIIVRNKIDLTDEPAGPAADNTIRLSAKTGDGIDALRETIRTLAGYENQGRGCVYGTAAAPGRADAVRRRTSWRAAGPCWKHMRASCWPKSCAFASRPSAR